MINFPGQSVTTALEAEMHWVCIDGWDKWGCGGWARPSRDIVQWYDESARGEGVRYRGARRRKVKRCGSRGWQFMVERSSVVAWDRRICWGQGVKARDHTMVPLGHHTKIKCDFCIDLSCFTLLVIVNICITNVHLCSFNMLSDANQANNTWRGSIIIMVSMCITFQISFNLILMLRLLPQQPVNGYTVL